MAKRQNGVRNLNYFSMHVMRVRLFSASEIPFEQLAERFVRSKVFVASWRIASYTSSDPFSFKCLSYYFRVKTAEAMLRGFKWRVKYFEGQAHRAVYET